MQGPVIDRPLFFYKRPVSSGNRAGIGFFLWQGHIRKLLSIYLLVSHNRWGNKDVHCHDAAIHGGEEFFCADDGFFL